MSLYCGIDLHSNNSVVVLSDERDKVIMRKRLTNDLEQILSALSPYQDDVEGVVVESTYNWYWLVDGLEDAHYRVHLANTAAIQQYEGLKFADDNSDSRWLAHMLRLGILKEGYICPRELRCVRDMFRKRSYFVQQRTSNILSMHNLIVRNTGRRLSSGAIKKLDKEKIEAILPVEELALPVLCSLEVMKSLNEQIKILEKYVLKRVQLHDEYKLLLTTPGIGIVLGLTIMLETGEIARFDKAGNYVSYARCVDSKRTSNGKKKGSGNVKNGNPFLAWAFIEAATYAIRYNDRIKRYYQRKCAKTKSVVARKAVAHKLARACFYILRDQVPFEIEKLFV